jgi:hypothetical protein
MTSIWQRLDVEAKVVAVLASVQPASSPRFDGNPFLTAYQLAILLDDQYPEVRQELGPDVPIGGAGSGSPSLARYLAQQLAAEIRRRGVACRMEAATLSRSRLGDVRFKVPGAPGIWDSNAKTGWDLSLFRLRAD